MKTTKNITIIASLVAIALLMAASPAHAETQMKIFAPNASSVTIKGAPVDVVRQGDFVVIGDLQNVSINDGNNGSDDSDSNSGNSAPSISSVSPSNGSGTSQTFVITATDADGAQNINTVELLINSNGSKYNGVYASVGLKDNRIFLRTSSTGSGVTARVGSKNLLSSNEARIDARQARFTKTGNTVTVEIPVEFRDGFSGQKDLYAKVIDSNKAEDGFKRVGTFTIGNENKLPRVVAVNSELLNQDVAKFTTIVEDENGFEDIASLRLVINKNISASDSVYVLFDAATEELFLRNDHGTRWIDSGNKKGRVLVNSQARIDTSRLNVTRSGNRMQISFTVEFTGKHGLKKIFAKASDISQAETKWVKAGTHNVSQITVADNGSLEDEFKAPFKNLEEKVSGKQGLHEYNVRKNRLMTHFTAFVGEEMVQAADTDTWQGATRKIRVDGDNQNAMGIAHSVQSESVVRLSGTMTEGLRLVYRHRNAGNYQFIDVQHDAKNNKRVVTSGYVVNGVEKIRKVVSLKNKGAGNELSLTINNDAKSMKVTFNGNQVFAGAFKDSIQGKLALQTSGQLDIVYSIVK